MKYGVIAVAAVTAMIAAIGGIVYARKRNQMT